MPCNLIKNRINYQYYLFDIDIKFEFKDLEIIFYTKSNFSFYSEMINKDKHDLGFIKLTVVHF